MRRIFAAVFLAAMALPALADDPRAVKRDLVRELLNVIDTKTLIQQSLDTIFTRVQEPQNSEALKGLSEDERKAYEQQMTQYRDSIAKYRERLFARIDYVKFADEVYAPIFDKAFSADDLRQLIAFYKTPAGQRMARTMPEFAVGGLIRGSEMMTELGASITDEMQKEESSAHPWRRTMADLRSVATATEAYATDTNKYPQVRSYEDLGPILSPTYIRTMPDKDGWGTPYMYVASPDGQHYRFVSAGADKKFDWNATTIEALPENFQGKPTDDPNADIIYQDGQFVQYPSGSTKD